MLNAYIRLVRNVLPSPFSIALVLTVVSFLAVLLRGGHSMGEAMGWWSNGLWDAPLMVFAMQMMLMLVLGHVLALSPFFGSIIDKVARQCNSSAQAAFTVCLLTLLVGLFNWGLGLIFGAILARKVGESFKQRSVKLNYALTGAGGYSALLIWHGGLSGSALIKAAEPGHLSSLMSGVMDKDQLALLPEAIPLSETVFSLGNGLTVLAMLVLLPLVLYAVGKWSPSFDTLVEAKENPLSATAPQKLTGAEHIDHSIWISRLCGSFLVLYCLYLMFWQAKPLQFFTPNNINLLLFSLCLLAHRSFHAFLSALDEAIMGASGILIQFPLYFGIMGLIRDSGLIHALAGFFVRISTPGTYPVFTFISAALVNVFVPSGGGQWAVQGPIIVQSSLELGVPLQKGILALAYGDQVTNMLQPFWALPLLGITKLGARDILPYTLVMFAVGFAVYFVSMLF